MAHVTIIPHLQTPGWDGDLDSMGDVPLCRVVTLQEALSTRYEDAPLMQLGVLRHTHSLDIGDSQPRLTKNKALNETLADMDLELIFECIVFDVDCKVKGTDGVAPDAWRAHHYNLLRKIPEGYGFYDTPGGYRLLWNLPSALNKDEYTGRWLALRDHLASILEADDQTTVDPACKDWTRLFFLPKITKPGYGKLALEHDFEEMGVLNWNPPGLFSTAAVGLEYYKKNTFTLPDRVPDGQRNETMFQYACSLRARGGTHDVILEKVRDANDERCVPPLEPDEVEKLVEGVVARYDLPEVPHKVRAHDTTGVNPADNFYTAPDRLSPDLVAAEIPVLKLGDEAELAELLLSKFEDDNVGSVVARGEIHYYNKLLGYWEAVRQNTLLALVQRFSGIPVESGVDKDTGAVKTRPLKVSMSSAKGAALFAYAMRDQGHNEFFDYRVPGVVFRNGFVRIDRGEVELLEPDPQYRSDVFLDYDYTPGAKPERFISFLQELFACDPDRDDKVRLVREFFGAAMAGQMTRYAKALLLLGDGSNGKSTLLQIIEALFPQKLRTSVPPHEMHKPFSRANFAGKTINIVTEMPKNAILDSEGFKAIISGDQIQAERKHEQGFVFRPTAAHVFAANTLPAVADSSDGFWRRWLVLDFNRTFTKKDAKPGLANEIIKEELGLIASWLIEAAAEVWTRRYFSETDAIAARRRAWRGESDTVQQFLMELMDEPNLGFANGNDSDEDGLFVENSQLYQKYMLWAQMVGLKARSKVNLSKELVRLGLPKDRKKGKRGFVIPKNPEQLLH